MKKGYIKIPINEVWELINKPHRFFHDLAEEVKALPLGEYEYLNFNQKDKQEIIKRLNNIALTGSVYK